LLIVFLEITFTEPLQCSRWIDIGILQVVNGRPECTPRPGRVPDSLQGSLTGEFVANNMTNQLFEEQLVHDSRQRMSSGDLSSQPQGQLMKGQYVYVQERQPVFDGEQGTKAIG